MLSEGFAREFINKVQNLRKDRKMHINDRIKIKYKCDDELKSAIIKQKKYIEDETLASELEYEKNGGAGKYDELDINGRKCKIAIEKV